MARPKLYVIASRPVQQEYRTVSPYAWLWREISDCSRIAFYGFCILAGVYLAAVLVLSLQVPR